MAKEEALAALESQESKHQNELQRRVQEAQQAAAELVDAAEVKSAALEEQLSVMTAAENERLKAATATAQPAEVDAESAARLWEPHAALENEIVRHAIGGIFAFLVGVGSMAALNSSNGASENELAEAIAECNAQRRKFSNLEDGQRMDNQTITGLKEELHAAQEERRRALEVIVDAPGNGDGNNGANGDGGSEPVAELESQHQEEVERLESQLEILTAQHEQAMAALGEEKEKAAGAMECAQQATVRDNANWMCPFVCVRVSLAVCLSRTLSLLRRVHALSHSLSHNASKADTMRQKKARIELEAAHKKQVDELRLSGESKQQLAHVAEIARMKVKNKEKIKSKELAMASLAGMFLQQGTHENGQNVY